ncbi:NADP-dependent oxidoreductase [Flavobacterium soyangense]|uniref:NADP-dependent oxidoreductase n=1 Tax=Flavobacterium soyangense TaxID=2023265 RepID=A0A930UFD0_9FLAO|nr:NADP-dependent oxidoreductase [Flavobacterium soyangense]MBF2709435.1 NADP-dependent oxidoreductase [Flavobacterium soyangense]
MKAIEIKKAGGVENLVNIQIETPTVSDGEVLIKVKAISINPVDYKARESDGMLNAVLGPKKPWILGWDISGTVEALGKNVTDYKIGDSVFGMINFPGHGKGYAEYVAAPATHITKKPDNVSDEEAAAATLAALTAWQALVTNAKIKKGDRILIHGAAGGVGHYAVQFAKHLGAYVIGTASAKNKDFVLGLGADEFIDYQTQSFENEVSDLDFVFDLFGDAIFDRSVQTVKNGGQIIALLDNLTEEQIAYSKSLGITSYRIIVHSNGEDMEQIASLLEKGIVKSHVSATFSFDALKDAHLQLATGRTRGKVVVVIE